MTTGDRTALGAAALFACAAIFAVVQLAVLRPVAGLSVGASVLVSVVGVILWGAAAATLAMRARRRAMRPSVALGWAGTFALLAQGLAMRAAGDVLGLALIVGAMIAAMLVQRAFTPLPWHDGGEPPAPRRGGR